MATILNNASATVGKVVYDTIVYKTTPWYMNYWIYIACFMFLSLISVWIYYIILNNLKNRLVVKIHMPDKTFRVYVYDFKKYVGDTFNLPTGEKTQEGDDKMFIYYFVTEYLELGKWGRYIDYNFKDPYPIKRGEKAENYIAKNFHAFVSSLINTELLNNLLLSKGFKTFMTVMLIVILIAVIVSIVLGIVSLSYHPVTTCYIVKDNATTQWIITAVKGALTK